VLLIALTRTATRKYFELLVDLPLKAAVSHPHTADPAAPSSRILCEQKLAKNKPVIVVGSPCWPRLVAFCVRPGPATILKASQD
jgi:hypothetical protein